MGGSFIINPVYRSLLRLNSLSACLTRSLLSSNEYNCVSGLAKPVKIDQPSLIRSVVRCIRQMIQPFNETDVIYVRNIRSNRTGVFNVECRSIAVASAVKSTFAGLVKSTHPPAYLKGVS